MHTISATYFDECFASHVAAGRHLFLKLIVTLRFFSIACCCISAMITQCYNDTKVPKKSCLISYLLIFLKFLIIFFTLFHFVTVSHFICKWNFFEKTQKPPWNDIFCYETSANFYNTIFTVKDETSHKTHGTYINNDYTNIIKSIKKSSNSKQRTNKKQRKHRKTKKFSFRKE